MTLSSGKYSRILSLKEAKSATMNFFRKVFIFFCKSRIKLCFHIKLFAIAENARKTELSYKKQVCFLLLVIICVPPIIIKVNL